MPKLKDITFHSEVKGPLVASISVNAKGIFTAKCDNHAYEAMTLNDIKGKINAYVEELDSSSVIFPVIEITENKPFGCNENVPYVGFEMERYWLSSKGWKCTSWAEPGVAPEHQPEDVCFSERIVEAGSVEAFIRAYLEAPWRGTDPDVLEQKFPVQKAGVTYLAYTRPLWDDLQNIQDKILELRIALFKLFGNPSQIHAIASTWRGLALPGTPA